MTSHILSADAQAILLLCGRLGNNGQFEAKPLTHSEYDGLAQYLQSRQMRPGDLLQPSGVDDLYQTPSVTVCQDRIKNLLSRGGALAFAVETWTNRGMWILSRSDSSYPSRLKARLGRKAPALLYGVGNKSNLSKAGLAIVGSRKADDLALNFTRKIASLCAEQSILVVSGGAAGVDTEAETSALKAKGSVIAVLPSQLGKASLSGKYRQALSDGNLVLISAYEPDANFNAFTALDSNKYIYGLSDWALVVSAEAGKGGTWSGGVENLKKGWVPLFVRSGQSIPEGNKELLKSGGMPLDEPSLSTDTDIRTVFRNSKKSYALIAEGPQELNFIQTAALKKTENMDLFDIIWPYLSSALATPKSVAELAQIFTIHPVQMAAWLARATELNRIKINPNSLYYKVQETDSVKS